ncbi:Hypothetical predicted protein [Olea europaea subsp. europaea]|uniref:Uncharacterized protein n=1 Tax=Olea europaea subsp. europaea TaxID=158383 RepID=A0A8S0PSU4_OLEEU|nr:Hypothetical predicted protein [Olea europaea subsp. europaea]
MSGGGYNQKYRCGDHDYANRPTNLSTTMPNVPQNEVRKTAQYKNTHNSDENDVNIPVEMLAINNNAELNGNSEQVPGADSAAKILEFTTVNQDDRHFTEEDLL